jgi:diguanylate cyclase (GGDEF)-like protein
MGLPTPRSDKDALQLLSRSHAAWPSAVANNPAGLELVALATLISYPGSAIVVQHDADGKPQRLWTNCHGRAMLDINELPIVDPAELKRVLTGFELAGEMLVPPNGRGVGRVITPLGQFHVISTGTLTALMADLEASVLTVWPDPVPGSPWHLVRKYAQYIGVIPLEQDWRARFFELAVDELPPPGETLVLFSMIPFRAVLQAVDAISGDTTTVVGTDEYAKTLGLSGAEIYGSTNGPERWSSDSEYVAFMQLQDSATGYGDSIGVFQGSFSLGRSETAYTWARHYIVDNLPATWTLPPPQVFGGTRRGQVPATTARIGVPIVTVEVVESGGLVVVSANEAAHASGLIPMDASEMAARFWSKMAERTPDALVGLGTMVQADLDDATVTVYLNKIGDRRLELAWLSSAGAYSERVLADPSAPRAVLQLDGQVLSANAAFCSALGVERTALVGAKLASVMPAPGLAAVTEELLNEAAFNRRGERLVAIDSGRGMQWLIWTAAWLQPDEYGHNSRIGFDLTELGPLTMIPTSVLTRDPLTGLHNRSAMTAVLRADPKYRYDGVAFLDVYGFKGINDQYGSLVADQCLITIANWLAQLASATDLLVRPSGDEFVVLASRIQTLVAAVERLGWPAVALDGVSIPIRLRLGWSARADHASLAEAARAADLALSAAKLSASGTVLRHVPEMADGLARKAEQESVLRDSLDGPGLSVAYQPIVDVTSGATVGYEALLRSTQASGVGPADLISAAERLGLAARLYGRAIEVAVRDADLVLADSNADLWLNLSRTQLAEEAVVNHLLECLADASIPTTRVVIEVTERDVDEPSGQIASALSALRRKGLRFAVDDFGKGASNLAALQQLEVDIVKLDLSLLPKSSDDARWNLVDAVNRMLTSLNLKVVAEGVEHAEQAERLAELGIHYQQGYLHGRPIMRSGT